MLTFAFAYIISYCRRNKQKKFRRQYGSGMAQMRNIHIGWNSIVVGYGYFTLDQRGKIFDQFRIDIIAFFIDPLNWNGFGFIGDITDLRIAVFYGIRMV